VGESDFISMAILNFPKRAGTKIVSVNLYHDDPNFLPAGRAQSTRPAGPKITLPFPRLYICISVYLYCASARLEEIMPGIIKE